MTDNVTANPGSGGAVFTTDNWTTDPKGSSQIPAIKVIWGARDSGYTFVDDTNGSRLPVKVGDPLPAGTNIIGALVANQSVNLSEIAGAAPATGHGTAAGALRVELPTDGQGIVGLAAGTVVQTTGATGTLTDRHGAITAGGTSQQIAAANPSRKYLLIWNPPTETETLFVNFTTAAAEDASSIPIAPGGSFLMKSPDFVSTEAVTAIAATTGHAFGCKEG